MMRLKLVVNSVAVIWYGLLTIHVVKSGIIKHVSNPFVEDNGVLELTTETAEKTSATKIAVQLYGNKWGGDVSWSFDKWVFKVYNCFSSYITFSNVPDVAARKWWVYKDINKLKIFCNTVQVHEMVFDDPVYKAECGLKNLVVSSFKFYYGDTVTQSFREISCKIRNRKLS